MNGIIYKATNVFNGKVYIGQTVRSLATRRKQHILDSRNDHVNAFHRALYQFPDSFEWEVVDSFAGDENDVIHKLNVAEEYHIIKYNSTDPRFGYNSTYGGYSSDKFAEHIIARAKSISGMSHRVAQYDLDGNFVQEFPSLNAVAEHLSVDKVQSSVLTKGAHYGYQWRIIGSSATINKIPPYRIKVKQTPTAVYDAKGELFCIFGSQKEAFAATGVKNARVRREIENIAIRDAHKRDYYFFQAGEYTHNKIDIEVIERKVKPRTKTMINARPVASYTTTGQLIAVYKSIEEASRATNSCATGIRRDCEEKEPLIFFEGRGRKRFWRFAEDPARSEITVIERKKKTKTNKTMEHRILQYSLDGKFIREWKNARKAAMEGHDSYGFIMKIMAGEKTKRKPNFLWRYYTPDYPKTIEPWNSSVNGRSERTNDTIVELDWKGNPIASYNGTAEAARITGCSQSYISNVLAGRIKHPKHKFKRA